MKDLKNPLLIVLLIMAGLILVLVFSGNSHLKEAREEIRQVSEGLTVLQDSLDLARTRLEAMKEQLDFTENQLQLLKTERDLLELAEQRKTAANWAELTEIKTEIQDKEAKRKELKDEADKYEL